MSEPGSEGAEAVTRVTRAALAPLQRIESWGRSASALCHHERPSSRDAVIEAVRRARAAGLRVGPRGAGQSYGDAALVTGGVSLDLSRLDRILDWNPAAGVARVEPGVTIGQLWRHTIEDGWWPAVVPGTSLATAGGCAAMNVHGKNNWKVGSFGEHVERLVLLLADGSLLACSRDENADVFHAAIGGFGVLGCIVEVTLRLKRVDSGLLDVLPLAASSLDEMLATFASRLDAADYLVGWVDCLARGRSLGRGLVHQARYLAPGEDPDARRTLRVDEQVLPDSILHVFPKSEAWRLLRLLFNTPSMRAVNVVKYRLGRFEHGRGFRQGHAAFNFLLDFFPEWRRAYGPGGMIQYQSFVPFEEAGRVFRAQLELAHARGLPPLLGVMKRHRVDPFLMTHAVDGYSLALEFKIGRGGRAALWALAREMDRLVLDVGGRFYFAKDSTLTRGSLEGYLAEARVQRFLELKGRLDPGGVFETDLFRRIFAPGE